MSSWMSRPKPPAARGRSDVEVTDASAGTFGPPCEATNFIAPMKQRHIRSEQLLGMLPRRRLHPVPSVWRV